MANLITERTLVLVALLMTAVALFATTFGADYLLLGAVQSPVYFPRIILGIMIALTVTAIIQDAINSQNTQPIEKWGSLVVFVIAALIYANAITRMGFVLSSIPFAVVSLWVFGMRSFVLIAAYAVLVPSSLLILFNYVLKLPLPTSPFTYLF